MNRSLDAVVARYVGYGLLFLLAAYLLYLVRGALPIFMVAALMAYAVEPLLQRLERRGHSRRSSVGVVFLGFLVVSVCMFAFLVAAWEQAQALSSNFSKYQDQLTAIVDEKREQLANSDLPPKLKQVINQTIQEAQEKAPGLVVEKVRAALSWSIGSIGLLILLLVVLPIITVWMMLEMNPLRLRLLMLVPAAYRRDVIDIAGKINELLGRYVRGQMLVCGLFGLLCTTVFYILGLVYGMNYSLVLGIVAAVLYIVPYLGMFTIATAAALTAYFTSSAPVPCAVIAVGSCFLFNLTIDYGISPRVLGRGVGLHPLLVIFALLSGAQVGGVLGMVLAIPVFASLRVVAIHLFPQLAAPLPEEPVESKFAEGEDVTDEIVQQTRDAETAAMVVAPASVPGES